MTSPRSGRFFQRLKGTLELIKFSHSVFALPFALSAMFVAAKGLPPLHTLLWILWCLVAARTAAMSFNRWADWDYDILNPRTHRRSELGTRASTFSMCFLALVAFGLGCWELNPLCMAICPLACLVLLGYSLTKRFTSYTHAVLGLALAMAPIGAWAATTGNLSSPLPWILAVAVWCWVFGFDLIYATQDIEFDRKTGLHSLPARYGLVPSLRLAKVLHIATWIFVGVFGWLASLSAPFWLAEAFIALALGYEHWLCHQPDLARINIAFFNMNAMVGLCLLLGVAASIAWPNLRLA